MTTNEKERKLDPKLALKFSDYTIDTFIPSFESKDEKGTFTKDRITTLMKPWSNMEIASYKIFSSSGTVTLFVLFC